VKRAGVKLGERDREALVALGNRLDEQLATVERHAHTLRHIFRRYRTWLNEGAAEALASERHLTAAQREDIGRVLKVEEMILISRDVLWPSTTCLRNRCRSNTRKSGRSFLHFERTAP